MSVVKQFIGGQWIPVVIGAEGPQGAQGATGPQGPQGATGLGVPEPIGSEGSVVTVSGGSVVWAAPSVQSVNSQTGIVSLDTDNIPEGSNLYYTNARVAAVAAPLYFIENVRTASYTLALSDVAKVIAFNSSSNLTLTVPTNASVAFPVGTVVNVYRAGTGSVTIAGASGVTVRNAGGIENQYEEVSLRKRATDEWVLSGNVV